MVLGVAILGLSKVMEGLTGQVKKVVAIGDNISRGAAGLGKSFDQTFNQFAGSIDSLRGTLDQRFGANILTLEAGLQGNSKGVAKLINQQQLTRGAFKQTAGVMAQLESTLGLTRDETNNLATSILDSNARYEISTDKLVDAVAALSDTFPVQALAGMGSNVMGAVTELQAELGPQLSKSLTPMLKLIMDPSMEAYDKLVRLGIGDVRERLIASKTQAESLAIFKSAALTADKSFRSLAKGPFINIGIAADNFGQAGLHISNVAANLGKRMEVEQEATDLYAQTMQNLKAEVMVPFQKALMKAYPIFVKSMSLFSDIAHILGKEFNGFIDSLTAEGGVDGAVKTMQLALVDGAIIFTEKLLSIFGDMESGFGKFFGPGGSIDKFNIAFGTIMHSFASLPMIGSEEGQLAAEAMMKDAKLNKIALRTLRSGPDPREGPYKDLMDEDFKAALARVEPVFKREQLKAKGLLDEPQAVKSLKELKQSIIDGNLFNRDSQEEQSEAAKQTAENTGVLADEVKNDSMPVFLDETSRMLGSTLEEMFGPVKSIDEQLLDAIENQTELLDLKLPLLETVPNNFGDQGSL